MRLRKRRSEVILTLLYDSSMPRYFLVVRKAVDCPAIFANAAVDAAAQVWPPPRQVLRHHRCALSLTVRDAFSLERGAKRSSMFL